jgi:hypothetical protein
MSIIRLNQCLVVTYLSEQVLPLGMLYKMGQPGGALNKMRFQV